MTGDDDARPVVVEHDPTAGEVYGRIADLELIGAIERRTGRRLAREFELPLHFREPKLHVEPSDWGAGQLLEVRVRDQFAPEMYADLRELTPQASLRDLYRPVRESTWHERETRVDTLDPGGRHALAEARSARRRDPLPRITPLSREVVAEQRRHRALLDERWQPAMPDDQERRKVHVEDPRDGF